MYKRVALNGLAAALALLGGAVAHADSQPGFYAGASIGTAKVEVDGTGFDADDTAFKLYGGYSFNEYFAAELAYFDGGKPEEQGLEVQVDGINLSAVGRLPLNEQFALFAKLGYATYDLEAKAGGFSVKGDDEELTYGVGAAFAFTQSFEVRAEYEAVNVNDGDFNFLSLGAVFKF